MITNQSFFLFSIPTFDLVFSLKSFYNLLKLLVINKFNRKMFFCKQSPFAVLMFCKSFI